MLKGQSHVSRFETQGVNYVTFRELNVRIKITKINNNSSQQELGPPVSEAGCGKPVGLVKAHRPNECEKL